MLCRHVWGEMTDFIRAIGRHWLVAVWLQLQVLVVIYFLYLQANPRTTHFLGIRLNGGFTDSIGALGMMSLLLFPGIWVVSAFLEWMPATDGASMSVAGWLAAWFVAAGCTYLFWRVVAHWARLAIARYRGAIGSPAGAAE